MTLNPTAILNFRYGFARWLQIRFTRGFGFDQTALGYPSSLVDRYQVPVFPTVGIENYSSLGRQSFLRNGNDTHTLLGSLTKLVGKHSLKIGVDARLRRIGFFNVGGAGGSYNFNRNFTRGPDPNVFTANAGNGIASFLLSVGGGGSAPINETASIQNYYASGFVQDDYKVTPRLTLNLGLRYELYPSYPWVEVADRGAFLDFQTLTVSQLGTGNISRTGVKMDKNNFAPRVGLAYRLTNRTVLRSAYGVFYAAPQYEISRGPAVNPPFAGAFSFNNNQLNFTGARKIDEEFDRTFSAAGATLFAIDPNLRLPYVQQWNLNIQQQLPGEMTLTTAYVGTKGVKLRDQININQPRPGPGAVAARRPYPQFNDIQLTAFRANSIYHGLQASLDKRFTGGLSFLVSYTYAHAIDDADVFGGGHQDVLNLRSDRGHAPFDIRQMLVISYNYDLPFAKNADGWTRHLFGGCQTNGFLRLIGGTPFTPTMAANSLNGAGFQRPNAVAGCDPKLDNPTVERWFETSCFTAPPQFTFGNVGRNTVFGPGTKQLDFSVFRGIGLGGDGKRSLQLRAEIFNLTNTPQFNNPNASIGSPQAGVVGSAGSPPSFQRTSRQIQIAAKLLF